MAIAVLIGAGFNAATRIVWPLLEEPLMPEVEALDDPGDHQFVRREGGGDPGEQLVGGRF